MWRGRKRSPLIELSWLKWKPVHEMTEEMIVERLDQLLKMAVKKMISETSGPFGFSVSGGIDSGIILAVASKLTNKPLHTFHLSYISQDETEGTRRDREYARWISQLYKTKHTEFVIRFEDIWNELPLIMRRIEEPFSGYVSVWFISRFLMERGVLNIFTGDWADELFGSYKAHRLAYQYPNEPLWKLRYMTTVFKDHEKEELYSKEVYEQTKGYDTLKHLRGYFEGLTAEDPLNRMLESEFRSWFPDHTYMSMHKLSTAWHVKIRSPWGDPEVANFVAKIPGKIKMKDGETKYVEKKLAERYLPDDIVYREKQGFTTPTCPLVLSLEDEIRSSLSSENLKKHGLFSIECVQKLLDSFYSKPIEDLAYKIWNLASFQVWFEAFWRSR
jgi:asparagine synthase (glutamine-hydrolysing)